MTGRASRNDFDLRVQGWSGDISSYVPAKLLGPVLIWVWEKWSTLLVIEHWVSVEGLLGFRGLATVGAVACTGI